MTLDRRQVACLEQWLPAYLSEPTDPVIVSLLDCGQPQQAYPRDAHSDTVINPTIAEDGDKDAAEKIHFLTKKQLECLSENLDRLKRTDAEPITFEFSRCEG